MDRGKGMALRGTAMSIVGALLVLAGIALAAMTAHSLLNYRAAASLHGGEVVDLGADAQPQPGQHGHMVRVVGIPKVVEAPRDPEFNLSVNTPVLVRHVEMFQWRELRIGGVVHYEMDWVDHLIDAGNFQESKGHANPDSFPLSGKQFDSGLTLIGGFKLGPVLLHALPGAQTVTPDPATLPENLAASFSRYQDYLVTSARPGDPRLGDVRVSWSEVPLQQVTIVARIDGDRLVAAADAADGKGHVVQIGDMPVLDIFPDLPIPPEFVWSWRILAVLLASLGAFVLLVARRNRRDVALALGLGAQAVGVVSGVLWLGYSMRTAGMWLAVAALGAALTWWRLRRTR